TFSFLYGVGSVAGPVCTGWVSRLCGMNYLFYPMTAASLIFVFITIMEAKNSRGTREIKTS
ncbi:MAG: hypothetical protein NTV89_07245, partial [Proteobacteria bacterium]|nr:hypothetical protein [Pseudomonadota bacterium]